MFGNGIEISGIGSVGIAGISGNAGRDGISNGNSGKGIFGNGIESANKASMRGNVGIDGISGSAGSDGISNGSSGNGISGNVQFVGATIVHAHGAGVAGGVDQRPVRAQTSIDVASATAGAMGSAVGGRAGG